MEVRGLVEAEITSVANASATLMAWFQPDHLLWAYWKRGPQPERLWYLWVIFTSWFQFDSVCRQINPVFSVQLPSCRQSEDVDFHSPHQPWEEGVAEMKSVFSDTTVTPRAGTFPLPPCELTPGQPALQPAPPTLKCSVRTGGRNTINNKS